MIKVLLTVLKKSKMILSYLNNIRYQEKPLKFLIAKIVQKTFLCKMLAIRIKRKGYVLRFSPTSLAASLWTNKGYRENDEKIIKALLHEDSIFIDAGANIGTHSLAAATIIKTGMIYAIEAHPRTFKFLSENILLNGFSNITPINCAVGNDEGFVSFSNVSSDDMNHVLTNSGGIKVPVKKLKSLIKEKTPIQLLKIDVEGYEKMVLEGAGELLEYINYIYFESFEKNFSQYNYTTGDIIMLLESKGFRCYYLNENDGVLQKIGPEYISPENENLLAVKQSMKAIDKIDFK